MTNSDILIHGERIIKELEKLLKEELNKISQEILDKYMKDLQTEFSKKAKESAAKSAAQLERFYRFELNQNNIVIHLILEK